MLARRALLVMVLLYVAPARAEDAAAEVIAALIERRLDAGEVAALRAEAVRDPAATARNEAVLRRELAVLRGGDAVARGRLRQALRLAMAEAPAESAAARLVAAADPVVVWDPARRLLVTERSLRLLREATAWTARAYGVAEPGADFVEAGRAVIRRDFAAWPETLRRAYAEIEANLPAALQFFEHHVDPAQRDAAFAAWGRRGYTMPQLASQAADLMRVAAALLRQRRAGAIRDGAMAQRLLGLQRGQSRRGGMQPGLGPVPLTASSTRQPPAASARDRHRRRVIRQGRSPLRPPSSFHPRVTRLRLR